MKEILVLGAGNIGRSFLTPVFLDAGYTVFLADINEELIHKLNEKKSYPLHICSQGKETVRTISGFQAIGLNQKEKLDELLQRVGTVVSSVGQKGLPAICRMIGQNLERRNSGGVYKPLDLVLAENVREGASLCRSLIEAEDTGDFPLSTHLGLVETSIGKMVPLQTAETSGEDGLGLRSEPYNTLIMDRDGFRGELPSGPDIKLVSPIKAWVDRKLFIHNLGHASAAYLGRLWYPEETHIAPLMGKPDILETVYGAMKEGASVLLAEYPEIFSETDLEEHMDDLLQRFSNSALGDTVWRVGRDLSRKLGGNDRLAGAMRAAVRHGLPIHNLLQVYKAAMYFGRHDESGPDHDISCMAERDGIKQVYLAYSCSHAKPDEADLMILDSLVTSSPC